MIVPTITTLGIQCSKCGELQFRAFSLFTFSHFTKESYYCSCGALLLTITHIDKKTYSIEYPCIYCGESHFLLTKGSELWSEDILSLLCSNQELPIGYFGPKALVVNRCQEIKKKFVQLVCQLVNDEDKESEFDIFFVIYAVMEKLSRMVDQGKLGCRCGNKNLAVEILPDRIELACESCDALGIIHTNNKSILYTLDNMGCIYLEENMTLFINDTLENWHLQ